jgi:hypothetical protein
MTSQFSELKKVLVSLLVVAFFISMMSAPLPVLADIGIEPKDKNSLTSNENNWLVYKTDKGSVIEDAVVLTNNSNEDVIVEIKGRDAEITSDGKYTILSSTLVNASTGQWIQFATENFTIPSSSSITVPFKIVVPQDAPSAEYGAGISVQQLGTRGEEKSGNVTIKTRNALRLYITVGKELSLDGAVNTLNIIDPKDEDFELQKKKRSNIGRDNFSSFYKAQNIGNINSLLSGEYKITFPSGKEVTKSIKQELFTNTPAKEFYLDGAGEAYQAGTTKISLSYTLTPLNPQEGLNNKNVSGTLEDSVTLTQEEIDAFGLAKTKTEVAVGSKENAGIVSEQPVAPEVKEEKEDKNILLYVGIGLLSVVLLLQIINMILDRRKKDTK